MLGPKLGTALLVSLHAQGKSVSLADIGYFIEAQAMRLSAQDRMVQASALSQELSWRRLHHKPLQGWQTSAPIVLLFVPVQTPEGPLIPENTVRESVVSCPSRCGLSFQNMK